MCFDDDYRFLLDQSVAPRRFILVNEASREIACDREITPAMAADMNTQLWNQGVNWRWFEMREAA